MSTGPATELKVLLELGRLLSQSLDPEEVGQRIADSVRKLFGALTSVLFRLEPETGALVSIAVSGPMEPNFGRNVVFPRGTGLVGLAVQERQPLGSPNVLTDPRITLTPEGRAMIERAPFRAVLAVPLLVKDRAIGALSFGDRVGRKFDADEVRLMQAFADQAALALDNARLYRRAEERAQKLTALSTLTRVITSTQESPRVFDEVAKAAANLLGAKIVRVWVNDPEGRVLRVQGSFGIDPEIEPSADLWTFRYGEGLVGRAFEAGAPEYVLDVEQDPRWLAQRLVRAAGVRAFAGLPLIAGDHAVGVLSLLFGDRAPFTSEEQELMELLADHAAIAIRNAELFARECAARDRAERSQQRFRDLVQDLDAIVWEADAATLRFSFVSQRAERILGYPVEQWLQEPDFWVKHLHPDDREATVALCRQATVEGRDHEFEYRMVGAEGQTVWFRDLVRVIRDAEGVPQRLRGVLVDVTQRKRTEDTLRKLSSAVHNTADSVFITDRNGFIEYVNPSFEELTGYSIDEVIGRTPRLLKSGKHDEPFYEELWRTLLSGRAFHATFVNKKRDGSLYDEEKTISPLKDAEGRVTHFVSTGRDITVHRRLEDQLRQSQKMEAVGRLAGGVAHDFNNLLTVMTGRCQLMLTRLRPDDPFRRDIEQVRKTADRAAVLTRQLLAFSRKQMLQPRVLDLNAVVREMHAMLQRLIGEDIELALTLDPALGRVKADPGQIEQVVANLAVNARDAMPQGGRLILETANVELDAAFVRENPGARPGPQVLLAVKDTGCGMDTQTLAHLFEPFFTTKGPGKGTGLGLATVYGIVKQHDGYIAVESKLGRGTTVRLYLPKVEGTAEVAGTPPTPAGPTRGAEIILLVEDEEEVRAVAREMLELSGYTVLEARDGGEALLICERHNSPIHLMVTDVVMPHMSGPELAQRLAHLRRDMKVLFISGYTDDALGEHGVLSPGTALLHKPFSPDALARRVREVLDAPSQV